MATILSWVSEGSRWAAASRPTPERLFTPEEKRGLQGLCLASTCFDHVDFGGADLAHAVFDHVSLVGCDFRGARLTLATFRGCDLRDALFDQATLFRGSRFDGSSMLGARGLTRSARALVRRTGGILLASVLA
jgi:uncharacterized protein YjbI with pentapeptide repeats